MKPPRFVVLIYLKLDQRTEAPWEAWVCAYVGDDQATVDRIADRERAKGRAVVVSLVTPLEAT